MLLKQSLHRKAGYSSIMFERCSKTIWILHYAILKIVDAPVTLTFELTLEVYQQSLGAQQLYMKSIQPFLPASLQFRCIII